MPAEDSHGIPLETFGNAPSLSLTTIEWVTEIPMPDEEDCFESVDMFDVVGEQHRVESVAAAAVAIAEEGTFQPARFWLMPDDNNAYDPQAVAVYATANGRAYHVGFLPRQEAVSFRGSMNSLGRPGQSLEVLGCITAGKTAAFPNARIYLPIAFADHVQSGYVNDPANQPEWLRDMSPVEKRPPARRAEAFTDVELCKIYCRHAKQKLWFNFPGDVEGRATGFRSSGLGFSGDVLGPYYDEQDDI